VWRAVGFMYHGSTGCNRMVRCDLHGGHAVLVVRCTA